MSNQTKFNTHHFPVGTLYTVKQDNHLGEKHQGIFEVQKVIRNGHDSYCVESTTLDNQEIFKGMYIGCNIDHIDTIVKRSNGPMNIENWYNNNTEETLKWKISSLNNSLEIAKKYFNISKGDIPVNVNNIGEIQFFYGKEIGVDQTIDIDTIWTAFVKRFGQPVCVKTTNETWYSFLEFTIVKKKALKKWFKQNQNRFLTSIKKAAEEYDKMMFDMDNRDFDRDKDEGLIDNNSSDDIRDGRVMQQMEEDYNVLDDDDYSFKGDSIFASTEKSSKVDSLTPITENSPGMDKLIVDLKKDPNEKGNPEDF